MESLKNLLVFYDTFVIIVQMKQQNKLLRILLMHNYLHCSKKKGKYKETTHQEGIV